MRTRRTVRAASGVWWIALTAARLSGQAPLGVNGLRVEYQSNPIGIDAARPRFSWRITSGTRNTLQTAYQLQVGLSTANLVRGGGLFWDSGRNASDASVFVDYAGPALASHTRYYWRVRVWDSKARVSAWSP